MKKVKGLLYVNKQYRNCPPRNVTDCPSVAVRKNQLLQQILLNSWATISFVIRAGIWHNQK